MENDTHNSIVKPIELIGDPWTLMIVKCLIVGPKRFNELKNEIPGINNRTLSARLKSLALDGAIQRQVGLENPPTVKYYVTALGKGIGPILQAIEDFGNKFMND